MNFKRKVMTLRVNYQRKIARLSGKYSPPLRKILFPLLKGVFRRILLYMLLNKREIEFSYKDPDRNKTIHLMYELKRKTEVLMDYNAACQLFKVVKKTNKIKGELAEVGVYKGGSAKIICGAKGKRPLHLFDTFEGLPKVNKKFDHHFFYEGQFKSSLKDAKDLLKKHKNVFFYKGIFPTTVKPIKNKKFSFVYLDVDIYQSALDCLKFFYPRMNRGGIIMAHDYNSIYGLTGVTKAFNEFFKDKPEPIIELLGTQCLIVKL